MENTDILSIFLLVLTNFGKSLELHAKKVKVRIYIEIPKGKNNNAISQEVTDYGYIVIKRDGNYSTSRELATALKVTRHAIYYYIKRFDNVEFLWLGVQKNVLWHSPRQESKLFYV